MRPDDPLASDDPLAALYNWRRLSPLWGTSGQPEMEQFARVRDAGFETVLNLLPPGQEKNDEEAVVEDLGLEYVVVPVVWMDPRPRDWERFAQVLDARAGRPVFVHCAANMRVSAFFYLLRTRRGLCSEAQARADLEAIWTPNPIWSAFLERMRAD